MIPLVGDSFKALKYTDEAAALLKYGDEVVDMGAAAFNVGSKKASKKAKKEFVEVASKNPDAVKGALHSTMDIGNGDFYIKNTDGIDFKIDLNKNDFPTGVKESVVAGCFLGETKVKTEDGFVAIKDIEEGNKVLTVNEETGQEEYKEVKKVFIRSGNEICIIKAGNDIIKATTGHLFKVKDKWWTAAINIEKGDYISTDDNKYLQVDDISVEKNNYPSFVYNLSVEENHNYFVGEEKILVHNMANMKSCTQGIEGAAKAEKAISKIDEIEVKFNYKSKYDEAEFARQLADQEAGMNKLTVDEYLKNRERYISEGRAIEGNMAQQLAREEALTEKIDLLMDEGYSLSQAKVKVQEWIDTQAALHNPDQVAGGNPLKVDGMGDKKINSSIGSQWRYRIDYVDEKIQAMAKNMADAERKNTYLNVKLKY